MHSTHSIFMVMVGIHLFLCSFTYSKSILSRARNGESTSIYKDDITASSVSLMSSEPRNFRIKRDREGDMKNFHWSFSVESPSIQVGPPSYQRELQRNKMPEISVRFVDGFESFGAPGEQASRLRLEEIGDPRAEGWDRSKSVFAGPTSSCCGPNYPFRTCCQT